MIVMDACAYSGLSIDSASVPAPPAGVRAGPAYCATRPPGLWPPRRSVRITGGAAGTAYSNEGRSYQKGE